MRPTLCLLVLAITAPAWGGEDALPSTAVTRDFLRATTQAAARTELGITGSTNFIDNPATVDLDLGGNSITNGVFTGDGSGLTNLNHTIDRISSWRDADSLKLSGSGINNGVTTITGYTNAHGSILWRDETDGEVYVFITTRSPDYDSDIIKIPLSDPSSFTAKTFTGGVSTSRYASAEQIQHYNGKLYSLHAAQSGQDGFAICEIEPSAFTTNLVYDSATYDVSTLGTFVVASNFFYVANGLSYPGTVWKVDPATWTVVATNVIQGTIPSASDLVGASAHAMEYDGDGRIYMSGFNNASGTWGWVGYIDITDFSFTGANFTNALGQWEQSTDDICVAGDWVFVGPESSDNSGSVVAAVKKDLSEVKWIPVAESQYTPGHPCYGTFYLDGYVYAAYTDDNSMIARIDPGTLAVEWVTVPGISNVNELLFTGSEFVATQWESSTALRVSVFDSFSPAGFGVNAVTNLLVVDELLYVGSSAARYTTENWMYGAASLSASADRANNYAVFSLPLPEGINTNYPIKLRSITWERDGGFESGNKTNVIYITFKQLLEGGTLNFTQTPTYNDSVFYFTYSTGAGQTAIRSTAVDLTLSETSVNAWFDQVAGNTIYCLVHRDGDDASDNGAHPTLVKSLTFEVVTLRSSEPFVGLRSRYD